MKSLSQHLVEMVNNKNNDIKNTISIIENNNLDEIIIQKLQPTTEDEILNEKLTNLESAFQEVVDRLKYLGYVNVYGYRIQRKLTK